jgi:quercetin dioxygenase-like cupin family protein
VIHAAQIDELELFEGWSASDADMRVRAAFPVSAETGACSTAVVYFELEPGRHLGRHTDSAEELLLILSGEGEASVGDERAPVRAGSIAVVPALVPHGVANTGDETMCVLGFFSSNTVLSVFDEPMEPFATRYFNTPPVPQEAELGVGSVRGAIQE